MQSDHTRENRGRSRNLLEFLQLVQFLVQTWYNLGTPPETRGSSQTVNSLSFAAALILTQGKKEH